MRQAVPICQHSHGKMVPPHALVGPWLSYLYAMLSSGCERWILEKFFHCDTQVPVDQLVHEEHVTSLLSVHEGWQLQHFHSGLM